MKKLIFVLAIVAGLGICLYVAMLQTYGSYGTVRRRSCMSNLRQMAKAALLYSDSYDGHLMLSRNWMDTLADVSSIKGGLALQEGVFRCPCIQGKEASSYGYAYNSALAGIKESTIELPEHTPFFFESKDWRRNVADFMKSFSGPYDANIPGSERANVAYLTGHVERVVKE